MAAMRSGSGRACLKKVLRPLGLLSAFSGAAGCACGDVLRPQGCVSALSPYSRISPGRQSSTSRIHGHRLFQVFQCTPVPPRLLRDEPADAGRKRRGPVERQGAHKGAEIISPIRTLQHHRESHQFSRGYFTWLDKTFHETF